jgi:hypothetical protein
MMTDTPTQQACGHLHEIIALANRLISESINQSDRIDPPVRTIPKEDFVAEYMAHSAALVEFLDNSPSP